MEKKVLDLKNILTSLPTNFVTLDTNIKTHCWDSRRDFVIKILNRKILNKDIIKAINKYLEKNSARSFHYEGLVSLGQGKYALYWGS